VRVATLALLILTALLRWRSCGVVMAKFSGQTVTLRGSPTVRALTSMPRLHFNTHPIWQATKSKLERSNAFGFVSHEGSPRFAEPKVALLSFNYLICAEQDSGRH
jgi:hypothetical protein